MMNRGIQLDNFIRELKKVLESLIFKSEVDAKARETVDIRRESDRYIMVKEGSDDWTSYVRFDEEIFKTLGCPTALISEYVNNKETIPFILRDSVVNLQRKIILRDYVEKNNYYRMLNGLPNLEDKDLIYAPENDYGISTTIPLHLLSVNEIEKLRNIGLLTNIITKYPDKSYMNHLGSRSIDIYDARRAMNYDLLYVETVDPDSITYDFKKFYSFAREYFMSALYNINYANMYEHYDRMFGFFITVMATQRTISEIFKQGITRDFYDIKMIKYLFESYSIPFINEMSIEQFKILSKNLNILLSYKSSTRVLFDICSLFGYANVNIYKYFLVKNHKLDNEGHPVFQKISSMSEDGEISTDWDYKNMFELYFQKVDVKENNIVSAIEDSTNRIDYASLTESDPYWFNDSDLYNKIYSAKFNYLESKYISMEIMFKLTQMMYEICYTFRMIIDNNSEFKKIKIDIPKVTPKSVDLYSIIIFLCALFCKRYGFAGEIPLKPEQVACVYGFNFHADLEKIRMDLISTDNKVIDKSLVNYIINFNVNNTKDVARIFNNISSLKDMIVNYMATTKDIDTYRAYKALYKTLLIVKDKKEVYTKNDGTYANTYKDLLKDINSDLYTIYSTVTDHKEITEIFDHILYKLESLNSSYKYLHLAVDSDNLFTIITKLVNFFKSYTVDLTSSGILYLFNDKYFNMLKILDKIWSVDVKMILKDNFEFIYKDLIHLMEISITDKDKIVFKELVDKSVNWLIKEYIKLDDGVELDVTHFLKDKLDLEYTDILKMESDLTLKEKMNIYDNIISSIANIFSDNNLKIRDSLKYIKSSSDNSSILTLRDMMYYSQSIIDESHLTLKDKLKYIRAIGFFNEDGKLFDMCEWICDTCDKDNIDIFDAICKLDTNYFHNENITIRPQVDILADKNLDIENIEQKDSCGVINDFEYRDNIKFNNENVLQINNKFELESNMKKKDTCAADTVKFLFGDMNRIIMIIDSIASVNYIDSMNIIDILGIESTMDCSSRNISLTDHISMVYTYFNP